MGVEIKKNHTHTLVVGFPTLLILYVRDYDQVLKCFGIPRWIKISFCLPFNCLRSIKTCPFIGTYVSQSFVLFDICKYLCQVAHSTICLRMKWAKLNHHIGTLYWLFVHALNICKDFQARNSCWMSICAVDDTLDLS